MSLSLVGGGARSGKSRFALALARQRGKRPLFVATATRSDEDMGRRIDRHIADRGPDFPTRETPQALEALVAELSAPPLRHDVVLIDCLTLWLSNLMLAKVASAAIEQRVEALAETLRAAPFHCVLVTNEVGMGLHPETELGREFRDLTGRAHQRLAAAAGEVYFAVLGTILRLRPNPVLALLPDVPLP